MGTLLHIKHRAGMRLLGAIGFLLLSHSVLGQRSYFSGSLNTRPIIGILSQPWSDKTFSDKGSEFVVASYVKFLEGAGARVIPISYKWDKNQLSQVFQSINGLLLTGGGLDLAFGTAFLDTAKFLYDKAVAANDRGDHFPIWGTCQGHQALSILSSNNDKLLQKFVGVENISLPLDFNWAVFERSRMFSRAPASMIDVFATANVTANLHHLGVLYPDDFIKNKLDQTYIVTSTNKDATGKVFVSTMEGIKYPFFGYVHHPRLSVINRVQWHPEKSVYEWTFKEALNHSPDVVFCVTYLANFFVNEARKSTHSFPSIALEQAALIYNYAPSLTDEVNYNAHTYVADFKPVF